MLNNSTLLFATHYFIKIYLLGLLLWLFPVPLMYGFDKKSDHGRKYLSMRYTEHLIEVNIEASVSSICDSRECAC